MEELRVIAGMRKYNISFDEVENEMTQYLQKKMHRNFTWFGLLNDHYWVTIDKEVVPSFAWIHRAVFGDRPDWDSKFRDIPNVTFYNYRNGKYVPYEK